MDCWKEKKATTDAPPGRQGQIRKHKVREKKVHFYALCCPLPLAPPRSPLVDLVQIFIQKGTRRFSDTGRPSNCTWRFSTQGLETYCGQLSFLCPAKTFYRLTSFMHPRLQMRFLKHFQFLPVINKRFTAYQNEWCHEGQNLARS